MNAGAWVAIAAVLLALSFGLYRRLTDGHFRPATTSYVEPVETPYPPPSVEPVETPHPPSPYVELVETPQPSPPHVGRAEMPQPSPYVERVETPQPSPYVELVETSAAAARNLLAETPWRGDLGERATLLQFSSAFCAPCRATRRVLTDIAKQVDGVHHVEVDAEQHLDLVRRLHILRTPTTLILDPAGIEIGRASGLARRDQVTAVIAALP